MGLNIVLCPRQSKEANMHWYLKYLKVFHNCFAGDSSDYCSPECGKTVRGETCSDESEMRSHNYYWCNVGETWDYCSRYSCPIRVPPLYNDCSSEMVHKTVSFEYLYYPGYWLAILDYKTAALWKPNNVINGKDLYDQGHIWSIRGGKDGSVYLQTARPGYINYFLLGYAVKIGKNGATKVVQRRCTIRPLL